jgi:hypothetical protein
MGVAPGHKRGAARIVDIRADDAMGEETIVEREQDDIVHANLLEGPPLDEQHVTRANRGEHARAGHLHACSAEAPQQIGDQRRCGSRQEFFLTDLHGPLVGLIFPQASAIVSKTCSRMKAGFSYAFFADSCSGA